MIAWLKCQTRPGAFDNEVMVGISTTIGRRHIFVDSRLIRATDEFPPTHELMVRVLPSPSFFGAEDQYTRIALPQRSVEGDMNVSVLASDVSYD